MPKKFPLEKATKNLIIHQLVACFAMHTNLFSQHKSKLTCFYLQYKGYKKLFAYINPRVHEVVLGFSHYGTDALSTFPILKSLAHEVKQSMIKFSLTNPEDIQTLAIPQLIDLMLSTYQQ